MIHVTHTIAIDESEIQQEFIRASGPGGQNVNKVATAVQLRFDVAHSPSLSKSEEVRGRLISLARGRLSGKGVLIIEARRFRTQGANRQDAVGRLVDLIRKAAQKPQIRRKTRPTRTSKTRRLEAKRHRAKAKRLRRTVPEGSDG